MNLSAIQSIRDAVARTPVDQFDYQSCARCALAVGKSIGVLGPEEVDDGVVSPVVSPIDAAFQLGIPRADASWLFNNESEHFPENGKPECLRRFDLYLAGGAEHEIRANEQSSRPATARRRNRPV